MTVEGRRVLRPGHRIALGSDLYTVIQINGTAVTLQDERGDLSAMMLGYLLAAPGFQALDAVPPRRVPQDGRLSTLDAAEQERIRWLEGHLIELETGRHPERPPRAEYDPGLQRILAAGIGKPAQAAVHAGHSPPAGRGRAHRHEHTGHHVPVRRRDHPQGRAHHGHRRDDQEHPGGHHRSNDQGRGRRSRAGPHAGSRADAAGLVRFTAPRALGDPARPAAEHRRAVPMSDVIQSGACSRWRRCSTISSSSAGQKQRSRSGSGSFPASVSESVSASSTRPGCLPDARLAWLTNQAHRMDGMGE